MAGPNKNSAKLVDPRNARDSSYKKEMEEIVAENVCPLCPPMKWHPNPILQDDGRWLITKISHPYPNTKFHFLLISKKHLEELSKLSSKDLSSILKLLNWATKEFGIKGGGLTMRFGDTLYTGATIKHLHAHLIVPTVKDGKVSPVLFPIGWFAFVDKNTLHSGSPKSLFHIQISVTSGKETSGNARFTHHGSTGMTGKRV